MSLFRKPKKIQRRVFCADDDDDDAATDPQPPPPPVISREKKENKPIKSTQLLSFADEEEDGEVFKVKKSKQSSRLAKRKEKDRKRQPDGDSNKYTESNTTEQPDQSSNTKPKKKISLEGLILSGREALAADGAGDVSDDSPVEEADDDDRGFHRYRADTVRAALLAGTHIPDAALIHAARKTRQQARELGGADYISVKTDSGPGSRLVRDDGSGDEDEGRIQVRGLDLPTDKPKRGTAAAPTNEELDSEPDEWESQQIKKAMSAITDVTVDVPMEMNPFAVAPLPPVLSDGPAYLRPLVPHDQPQPTDAQALVDALRNRLHELQMEREEAVCKREELQSRLLTASRVQESRAARCQTLNDAYRRAQALRGYLTDLTECLDEKLPALLALEQRAVSLHRRRCDFLTERRRADVRDQAQDVLAGRGSGSASRGGADEAKVRRCAEREGRRRARRRAREAAGQAAHRDGDSSDDDLPPHEAQYCSQERESIRTSAASLFADALPAWRSVRGVCARLAAWRRRDPALYTDAYMPECLGKLLAPYVRHQLILWNPLADEDNDDYERMDWYRCLMMYGVSRDKLSSDSSDSEEDSAPPQVTETSVREDPDLFLVPTIVTKVLLPKVTELVECSWDPMCVRACIRLRQLVVRLCAVPGARQHLPPLAAAVRARLHHALAADVFLPTLPPQLLEGAGGVFWRRCLGAGVRLVRATLALTAPPDILHADAIVLQLIETLCTGAGAAAGPQCAAAAAALAGALPRAGAVRRPALRRTAALAALAIDRLHTDNPLHLKAVEQARGVLAEAKALG